MRKCKKQADAKHCGLAMMVMMVGLAGCAESHNGVASVSEPVIKPGFTVQTPIDQIAADKNGKEVLERDVPGLMSNAHYVLFSCMSLAQVASLSGGRLTQAKLRQVNQDLAGVKPCAE